MDFKFIYCNKCDGRSNIWNCYSRHTVTWYARRNVIAAGEIRIATLSIPDKVYQPTKCIDCGAPVFAELNGTGYCLACYREHTSQVGGLMNTGKNINRLLRYGNGCQH